MTEMTRHEPGCPKVYCQSCAVVIGEQHHTARQVLPSLQQSQRPDVKLRGTVMSAWPTGVPWTTVGPPFIAVYGVVDELIVPSAQSRDRPTQGRVLPRQVRVQKRSAKSAGGA